MPFPLHKAPKGLLELFRLRTHGSNPPTFGEIVAPSVDVTEYYGADLISTVSENSAAGAATGQLNGAAAVFARRYLGLSGTWVGGAAAGTWLEVSVGIGGVPGGGNVLFGAKTVSVPVAAAVYRVAAVFPVPLVLPPGAFPFVLTESNAAGVDHVRQLRYMFQIFDGR